MGRSEKYPDPYQAAKLRISYFDDHTNNTIDL